MNLSSKIFTALTVTRAMYGDIGARFSEETIKEIHHLPRGNASMAMKTNTSISGVFVYDCASDHHVFLHNEFAANPVPAGYFPDVEELAPKRRDSEQKIKQISERMFWPCDEEELKKTIGDS